MLRLGTHKAPCRLLAKAGFMLVLLVTKALLRAKVPVVYLILIKLVIPNKACDAGLISVRNLRKF